MIRLSAQVALVLKIMEKIPKSYQIMLIAVMDLTARQPYVEVDQVR